MGWYNIYGLKAIFLSTLFCIPPKSGCTSYRRALGSQFTKEFLRKGDQCKLKPCYNESVVSAASEDLGDNSEVPDLEFQLLLNEKSKLVGKQQLSPNEIGWPGQGFSIISMRAVNSKSD